MEEGDKSQKKLVVKVTLDTCRSHESCNPQVRRAMGGICNDSYLGRILDSLSPSRSIIYIFIFIGFSFYIFVRTSIGGLSTHILSKYHIIIYKINYFKKS